MRSTFKVLFYVNRSKEKNGIVPIMGRVTINGSVAQFSYKQSIHKDLWDVKGNRAKGKSKESRDINLAYPNRNSNTSQPMVQRAIRQTPTINPTTCTAKEKQRNETLNNNGDRIKWSPLLCFLIG